jgi:hypothetical protein
MPAVTLRTPEDKIKSSHIVDQQGKLLSPISLTDQTKLNDENQVERTIDEATRKRILRLHGIPVQEQSFINRQYIVYVFQTKALFTYRSKGENQWLKNRLAVKSGKSYERVLPTNKSKEIQNVQSMAIRAVFALGLDYAVVVCGIVSGKNIVIRNVNPNPKLDKTMEEIYDKVINQYNKKQNLRVSPEELLIGADPEFIMLSNTGNLILASKYFPLRGKVGCDAIWLGQNRTHKPIVEVRPEPTSDPRELVERIYHCLNYAANKVAQVPCSWLAGSMPYTGFPIGGHIHFSGVEPTFPILRALDNYLTLPLMMAEDEKGISRRPKYGFLGDFRIKNHGGFEYRTPPSWLVSPTLTKGVLALSKLIVLYHQDLTLEPLSNPDLQASYYKGEKEPFELWRTLLCQDIKDLPDYKPYAKYLDPYFEYLLSGKKWDETRDFRYAWRLPPYRNRNKKR